MKKILLLLSTVTLSLQLHANDSFNSEASHFVGGAVLAGVSTAVADQFSDYKQDRAIIGFGVSALYGLVDQSIQYAEYGGAGGQFLDFTANTLGAAFGAWLTDKYILTPVITHSQTEGKYVGLALGYTF
ncbi:hypothetical protein [Sulfurimonas paralvinellae]|uniref:Outer membrane protein beta-barrel domain-containing protein n=1 Tax=Sulfurimonas paralvinellae TaxID=317658 RepID=A0A7M1B6E0_9BACT|nr:hypothetical protein [Sulfurimonas paralvinellae]QOP45230.1 hypothetical protein FM071_02590 [Sulfurimonas paralvinellae]